MAVVICCLSFSSFCILKLYHWNDWHILYDRRRRKKLYSDRAFGTSQVPWVPARPHRTQTFMFNMSMTLAARMAAIFCLDGSVERSEVSQSSQVWSGVGPPGGGEAGQARSMWVNHSQRMMDRRLQMWTLCNKNETVLAAHCTCIAETGEACLLLARASKRRKKSCMYRKGMFHFLLTLKRSSSNGSETFSLPPRKKRSCGWSKRLWTVHWHYCRTSGMKLQDHRQASKETSSPHLRAQWFQLYFLCYQSTVTILNRLCEQIQPTLEAFTMKRC